MKPQLNDYLQYCLDSSGETLEQFASARGYTHAMAIELGADVMDALLEEDLMSEWAEELPATLWDALTVGPQNIREAVLADLGL